MKGNFDICLRGVKGRVLRGVKGRLYGSRRAATCPKRATPEVRLVPGGVAAPLSGSMTSRY